MTEKVEVLAESLEALADNIAMLSEIGKMMQKCRLKRRTIHLLLKDATGLPMHQIKKVIDALPLLEKEFLK